MEMNFLKYATNLIFNCYSDKYDENEPSAKCVLCVKASVVTDRVAWKSSQRLH
jgi:hypothetical protein